MNIARDTTTYELIEAEELRFIVKEDMPKFTCPDENCKVELVPASYLDHNKQRPHFRTLKGKEHSNECKFSKYAKLLEIGGKRKITFDEFENMPVPTKLIKPKPKKVDDKIAPSIVSDIDESSSYKRKGSTNSFDEGGNSFKSVTTISQITDFYLSCPFNRDIELNLLNKVQPYMYWFKRLKKTLDHNEPQEYNIYFGQLNQGKLTQLESDKEIKLQLYDCAGWKELETGPKSSKKQEQINPIFVTISKEKLSPNKVTRMKHEIEYALYEQKKVYTDKTRTKNKPYVFFIGRKKHIDNPYEYEVLEGYFVARYTEIKQTVNK